MMNEHPSGAESTRVQAALQALRTPAASPAFRADLKDRFMTGAMAQGTPRRRAHGVPWFGRMPLLGWSMAVAAAAAVVVIVMGLNRGPAWQPIAAASGSRVIIGGTETRLGNALAAGLRLEPGTTVSYPDSATLDLVAGDQLWIQFAPGSELRLPRSAGRWVGRTVRARVTRGEIRFTTGPAFAGARLLIETTFADVELLGSTIAVIENDDYTCVCAYEGTVRVGPRDGPLSPLPAGMRRFTYGDGRPPLTQDLAPMERMKLQMLRDGAFR
jgi:hypothetical protein